MQEINALGTLAEVAFQITKTNRKTTKRTYNKSTRHLDDADEDGFEDMLVCNQQ
ncbi:hypothetical protein CDL12_15385 [Handroanthus impetiginosus]|uniref:Uncharacterized protein n=1 Tax=Handroanthus impetiginosus TaxID=429701 RepID=A0A2G9H3A1_9LAMI|nr:hypothetical protein CDL12_15385 [Handroanthus impetiginosus]